MRSLFTAPLTLVLRKGNSAAAVVLGCLLAASPCAIQGQTAKPSANGVTAIASGQRVETEIVTIDRHGATPSQITRKPGKFFLEINNRIANPQSAVTLELRDGLGILVPSVIDSISLARKRISSSLADLLPGDYQLRVPQSGRILCTIHIH